MAETGVGGDILAFATATAKNLRTLGDQAESLSIQAFQG